MALETAALRRNLSRLEMAISIALIAVLVTLFMQRMSGVETAAEKAVLRARYHDMQARLMTLRTSFLTQDRSGHALTLEEVMRHIGRGDVRFVDAPGLLDWDSVPRGAWIYVRATHELHYRVVNEDGFAVGPRLPKRVRFQLEPRYADTNANGRYDDGADRLTGAVLSLLDERALAVRGGD